MRLIGSQRTGISDRALALLALLLVCTAVCTAWGAFTESAAAFKGRSALGDGSRLKGRKQDSKDGAGLLNSLTVQFPYSKWQTAEFVTRTLRHFGNSLRHDLYRSQPMHGCTIAQEHACAVCLHACACVLRPDLCTGWVKR